MLVKTFLMFAEKLQLAEREVNYNSFVIIIIKKKKIIGISKMVYKTRI